jgi:hypothetical protein
LASVFVDVLGSLVDIGAVDAEVLDAELRTLI